MKELKDFFMREQFGPDFFFWTLLAGTAMFVLFGRTIEGAIMLSAAGIIGWGKAALRAASVTPDPVNGEGHETEQA